MTGESEGRSDVPPVDTPVGSEVKQPSEKNDADSAALSDDGNSTGGTENGDGGSDSSELLSPRLPPPPPPPPPPKQDGPPRRRGETYAKYLKRTWLCEVEKASMQEWRKKSWHNVRWPMPIIQAFYLQKPGTQATAPSDETSNPDAEKEEAPTPDDSGDLKNLQRIQINSDYLHHELLSIASVSTLWDPLIVPPPYKLFLRFLPEIETRLAKLKGELKEPTVQIDAGDPEDPTEEDASTAGKVTEDSASVPGSSDQTPDEAKTKLKRADTELDADRRDLLMARYNHLECLYQFIQDELREEIEVRRRIADGTLRSIRFEDLWHLVEPGDIIFSKDHGRDQLYKVYFVTGGQALKRTRNREEITEINSIRDKLRYWIPPEQREEDDEETVEKMLREEGSGIGTWSPFKVDCYMMAFDGEYCGPIDVCKKIRPYVGEREITSLPMYPLRFHPKHDALVREMETRGRKFLFAGGHKSYDGRTLAMKRDESRVEIQSDVYVDFDAYYQDFPVKKPSLGKLLRSKQNYAEVEEFCAPGISVYRSLSGHEVDSKLSDDFLTVNRIHLERFKPEEDEISPDHLCLMPHYVIGYAFQLRKWYHLDLALVQEIDRESANARAAGFDDLVIPKRYRDLLVALVDNHASGLQREKEKTKHGAGLPVPTQIDIVRGKGQGLIILLHGPPGSGKTSTAETIAAYTRRPLYSITCGDIGTTPEIVETRLLEHTRRADKWGCVLLLDEADVFLVQRDWQNLQRNALVSVFLRQLEYYAGILFLTTNRPGVLDEAFKSRIHISLRYPSIDLESTKTMWKNIMKRLEDDNKTAQIKVIFDKDALLEFAQRHFEKCDQEGVTWNGRQIRNAFQTALALGHYERLAKMREADMTPEEALASGKKKWTSVKLTKANFQKIAKTATEFEQYIESLRGNDSVNARESELRYDDYDSQRLRARKQYPASSGSRDAGHQGHHGRRGQVGKQKRPVHGGKDTDEEEEEEEDDESEDLSPDEND